jgi:hypothetical protein
MNEGSVMSKGTAQLASRKVQIESIGPTCGGGIGINAAASFAAA